VAYAEARRRLARRFKDLTDSEFAVWVWVEQAPPDIGEIADSYKLGTFLSANLREQRF
jgi:hypothetical protein